MQIFARFHVGLMHGLTQNAPPAWLTPWHISRYGRRDVNVNAINERRAHNSSIDEIIERLSG